MTEQEANQNYIELVVRLECGTQLEIIQPERGMNYTISATPKPGIAVNDFADLKNDKLNIRLTKESLIGLYQTLQMIVEPSASVLRKPKSFFRKLIEL